MEYQFVDANRRFGLIPNHVFRASYNANVQKSLFGGFLETLLYGVYIVLFFICLYIFRGRKHSQNVVLVVTALLMFALTTAHLVTVLIATFDSVLLPQNGFAPEKVTLASGHIYVTNNILADGLIVYRCFMVWGSRRKIIILPVVLLLTTAVLGYKFRITIELIALSLVTSFIATGLTAGRIWWIASQTKRHLGMHFARRYNTAFAIVVESGLIYTISLIIFLVVYIKGPGTEPSSNGGGPSITNPAKFAGINTFPFYFPASYITYCALVPIMGIVSSLIIVRVGLGLSTEDRAARTLTLPTASRGQNKSSPHPPAPVVSVELSTVITTSPGRGTVRSSLDDGKTGTSGDTDNEFAVQEEK